MDDNAIKNLHDKFASEGQDKFYNSILASSIKQISYLISENKSINIDFELLSLSDKFLHLYRISSEENYFLISKIFRRAAHKIHRLLLKKHLTKESIKFLTLVSNGSHKH